MAIPADNYQTYYTEKIWQMIPAIYREEDTPDGTYGTLRAIVEVIAEQAVIIRRSQDKLWDDQFIDTCDDWAVSYIGDLLGTRLLSVDNPRGRRIDVSKTIYYRKRKGTPLILEQLINDVTGWHGKLAENFQRLGRTWHGLDAEPVSHAGRITRTMPGGSCDLRNTYGVSLMDGPFDEFFYRPDVRRHRGRSGRYAIPKLAFYLYRLQVYEIENPTAFNVAANDFTFDPSGRNIQLFASGVHRDNWDQWTSAIEPDMPGPISCRLLNAAAHVLYPTSIKVHDGNADIPQNQMDGVNLPNASAKRLSIDPVKGEFIFTGAAVNAPQVTYHVGFSGKVGAGTYERPLIAGLPAPTVIKNGGGNITAAELPSTGSTMITDNLTYTVNDKSGIVDLIIYANNERRPYIRLQPSWKLSSGAKTDSTLILDGLWIGNRGNANNRIIIEGDFKLIVVRNCTIDPGNTNVSNARGESINPAPLEIKAKVQKLCIENSIVGPIEVTGMVEEMVICNSVVQSVGAAPAIRTAFGKVITKGVTVFGTLDIHRLEASELIATDVIEVADQQTGCFRFSAAPDTSHVPRAYESFLFSENTSYWFTSMEFGDSGYAQITEVAPEQVRLGAENGSEMGAFFFLNNPIKFDGLKLKISEYMPFGLIPIFINKT